MISDSLPSMVFMTLQLNLHMNTWFEHLRYHWGYHYLVSHLDYGADGLWDKLKKGHMVSRNQTDRCHKQSEN